MTKQLNLIEEADAHLGAALSQVIPTDDKIIVEHMRAAKKLLSRWLRDARSRP
jgi:hypothetical protein